MCYKGKNKSLFGPLLSLKEKERERFEKEAIRRSLKEVHICIIIFEIWNFVKAEKRLIVCSFGIVQEKELRRQQEEAEKESKMREIIQ